MNRSEALTYLQLEYHAFSQEAGDTSETEIIMGGHLIDKALRALGEEEAALPLAVIDAADVPVFLALLDYHALSRFAREFAVRTDVSGVGGGLSVSRSQLFVHVTTLLQQAAARVAAFGLSPDGGESGEGMFTLGHMGLDFMEPDQFLTGGG